ncbi:hypothetical protein BCR34DRAFT_595687 [Clohesyomyces aquaticus]|uniref:Uncharacterized protein n=1 Tax=Clohesyomyces aquaticus TaxID=1231657 RepID=A0A1Y2A9S9_9PLEO|nr:hypothetical protein BCR34DRAFT_595687 [Clohesyomyces aquaticus]
MQAVLSPWIRQRNDQFCADLDAFTKGKFGLTQPMPDHLKFPTQDEISNIFQNMSSFTTRTRRPNHWGPHRAHKVSKSALRMLQTKPRNPLEKACQYLWSFERVPLPKGSDLLWFKLRALAGNMGDMLDELNLVRRLRLANNISSEYQDDLFKEWLVEISGDDYLGRCMDFLSDYWKDSTGSLNFIALARMMRAMEEGLTEEDPQQIPDEILRSPARMGAEIRRNYLMVKYLPVLLYAYYRAYM